MTRGRRGARRRRGWRARFTPGPAKKARRLARLQTEGHRRRGGREVGCSTEGLTCSREMLVRLGALRARATCASAQDELRSTIASLVVKISYVVQNSYL